LREPAAGNVPGGRTSAAGWLDSSGHLWLFGGKGNAASGLVIWLNDMWEFNTSTNEWAWMGGSSKVPSNGFPPGVYGTLGTPAPENIPGGRDASSRWTGSGDYLWLFGGWGADANDDCCSPNDLWKFNPSTDEWAWMDGSSTVGASAGRQGAYGTLREPAAGNVPGGRSDAASWTDSRGNLWLFGGDGYDDSGNDGWLNDLWVYQLTPGRFPATTPAFSVASGSYDSQQILKIADATPGAAIYYTLDGSTPTNKSDQYKTELAIAKTITVKAISEAAGYANSAVATATYVILKPQTITFTSVVGTVRFGGKPIALAAKASSGLAVKFSVVSGPAKVNGSSLTLTGVGKVVVAANQAGNSVYAAAPEATLTLEVYKGLQTIAFAQPASPVTYGVKPIDLSATASSGLAVTFWMVSGPGKLSGVNDATLTITGAGTVEVAAIQAGNADYGTAPSVTRTLTVDKATLSVTANNLSIKQGAAVPTLTYSFAGFVNGDTATSGAIIGKPALSTTATSKSPAGSYPIAVKAGTLAAKNYEFTLVNGVLTINP